MASLPLLCQLTALKLAEKTIQRDATNSEFCGAGVHCHNSLQGWGQVGEIQTKRERKKKILRVKTNFAGFPSYPAVLLIHEILTNVFIKLWLSIFYLESFHSVFHSFLRRPVPLLHLCEPSHAAGLVRHPQLSQTNPDQPSSGLGLPHTSTWSVALSLCFALWLFMHMSDSSPLPDTRFLTPPICICGT